jgi:CTP-dependent riboflavin kinase
MNRIKPDSVLPNFIRYDTQISNGAKILYSEILWLCSQDEQGFCSATNKQLADTLDSAVTTINKWLKELERGNHIIIHKFSHKGRKITVTGV